MKLYNTLSRKIEEFVPINSPYVGLYACGVTVYDYVHLGHLRKYTMDDVLIRVLRHAGYQVEFVQNITDVGHLASDADTGEDKLEKGAKKYGQTVWDIAKKFEDYFFYSMDLMNNLRPDVSCRATEHIKEQLQMVLELEKKGFTYEIKGDGIYFDTSKLPDYGKLARLKLDQQKEGVRVETKGKRNPSDFALWKFERENENRAMSWPSPWAEKRFPGWHIECSAMSMKYLGESFDIHTGGIDHIPVHHTNEIAQAEAATGKKPFVKHWVHHNFLRVNSEKMSKSLGNFFTIDDVLERGFEPMALRLLFLMTHYRSEMNFTWEALEGAQKAYDKLITHISNLKDTAQSSKIDQLSVEALRLQNEFCEAMDNDLATPESLATMWEVVEAKNLEPAEKLQLLFDFDQVLGLDLEEAGMRKKEEDEVKLTSEVQELLDQRQAAREARDYELADSLRSQIEVLGFSIEDHKKQQIISAVPRGVRR